MYIQWINATRWYTIRLNRDLLGDSVLEKRWGGLRNKHARTENILADQLGDDALERIMLRVHKQRVRKKTTPYQVRHCVLTTVESKRFPRIAALCQSSPVLDVE